MANRVATLLLQIGVIAAVVVALPYKVFELDRYFVPKELALHVVALGMGILLVGRLRSNGFDLADKLLVAFLAWSLVSALLATNHWAAQRALGVSVSSAIVFWGARSLGASGLHRPILVAAAAATVVGAITALAQAYGIQTDYFSLNRSPGGTFGNRNFVAHICAMGLPALVYAAVTARSAGAAWLGSVGAALVGAMLVLTRSRAAWLAVAATAAVLALPLLASRRYWREAHIGGRVARLAGSALLGGALAIVLPNTLNWSSDSPYLDSARGMVDYRSGSGRGRLEQYLNSMKMASAHPVFGVGPGNWPVRYVRYAPDNDPSLTDDGMTANPWPSSDWVAFVSERGVIAAAALLGVFALLFLKGCRRWSEVPGSDGVFAKLALVGTITATLVVSAFDAALLLAAPSILAWSIVGAASGVGRTVQSASGAPSRWRGPGVAVALVLVALAVARSATQAASILAVGMGGHRAGWVQGAALDPGSYRINVRVAELYANRGQCSAARPYARRARDLFPSAGQPRQLLRRCG